MDIPVDIISRFTGVQNDSRVLRFDPNALQVGANDVAIANLAGKPLEINRVNLGLW